MNPHTGQVITLDRGDALPDGFVPVADHVAKAQLVGQRVLASKALRRRRKVERQNRKAGRNR